MNNIEIRNLIQSKFSINEIKTLCDDLGISFDDLGESTREGAARELVQYFNRRSQLQKVIDAVFLLRPDVIDLSEGNPTLIHPAIKILYIASEPLNYSNNTLRLNLNKEYREINDQLSKSKHRNRFVIENPVLAAQPLDISSALIRSKPNIVHFSGHGSKYGELVLETIGGKALMASASSIENLFKLLVPSLNCVILNACYSKNQAKAIAQHVPYVIGMENHITDDSAIAFVAGFYQALGEGLTIDQAFDLGKVQVGILGYESENNTPILLQRR